MTNLIFATALLTLMLAAAIEDVRSRRIPNVLTLAMVALYPVHAVAGPAVPWPASLGLALLVFLVGLGLYRFGVFGGGDVKLVAALALWAGPAHLFEFLLVTGLAGGLLGLLALLYARLRYVLVLPLQYLALRLATGLLPARGAVEAERDPPHGEAAGPAASSPPTLPYGVAIAAGGFVVVFGLLGS